MTFNVGDFLEGIAVLGTGSVVAIVTFYARRHWSSFPWSKGRSLEADAAVRESSKVLKSKGGELFEVVLVGASFWQTPTLHIVIRSRIAREVYLLGVACDIAGHYVEFEQPVKRLESIEPFGIVRLSCTGLNPGTVVRLLERSEREIPRINPWNRQEVLQSLSGDSLPLRRDQYNAILYAALDEVKKADISDLHVSVSTTDSVWDSTYTHEEFRRDAGIGPVRILNEST